MSQNDKAPVPDQAEDNAYFPSPYSLTQYVSPKTDFDGADYPNKYTAGNAYWTAKFFGNATVDGEGVQSDYWNYLALAKLGINPSSGAALCK